MALGRISQIRGSELSVERLEEGRDELQSVWVLHGVDEETIARTAVRRVVAADYMQVVDPDRVSNPHGEHALEAYRLLEPLEPLQQEQEQQQQDGPQ
ncbi:hypothetical protein COHA_010051 [Chlorella ohadii]|uniref:Uncharacterized protein n=1 Tax=Chlorella ohadii TaxID=2649997 RepID=A0AAD5DEG8_9CHLO|nr:hypothetical protein COHA_010051 [Chlorella ohadii]